MSADRQRALQSYQRLAATYDRSCRPIHGIRAAAIDLLQLRTGQTVFDVACGTGETLVELARRVGPSGLVVGIEQSPDMARIARDRIQREQLSDRIHLVVSPVEDAKLDAMADALLFCYTHDVMQTPAALENLFQHTTPGARVAIAGARLLPWVWGWPLNLFTLYRGRHYLTTRRGLSRPWLPLQRYCPDLRRVASYHAGTSHLSFGTFR